jgi:hypothetical protein
MKKVDKFLVVPLEKSKTQTVPDKFKKLGIVLMNEIKGKVDYNEISFTELSLYKEYENYIDGNDVGILAEAEALYFHQIARRYPAMTM